jgi:tripartite-type tricarboxylate transporter receptor subunit TctC
MIRSRRSLPCSAQPPGATHAGNIPTNRRFILPNAAGGSPDTIARILAVRLTEILGQQFIIDNRPGAGGIIAVEAVAKATPDGYTLLQCGISQTISPALKRKLPYDTWRDFARIVQYGGVPNVLTVYMGLPVRNLADLVNHARANPGVLKSDLRASASRRISPWKCSGAPPASTCCTSRTRPRRRPRATSSAGRSISCSRTCQRQCPISARGECAAWS